MSNEEKQQSNLADEIEEIKTNNENIISPELSKSTAEKIYTILDNEDDLHVADGENLSYWAKRGGSKKANSVLFKTSGWGKRSSSTLLKSIRWGKRQSSEDNIASVSKCFYILEMNK